MAKKNINGYYNDEILAKFRNALRDAIKEVENGTVNTVSISKGNQKMGAVSSVSLLPFLTCPSVCKGTCGKDCYAAKLANLRNSVLKSYARNTALLMRRPDLFWHGVEYAIKASRFFRFHVSGDIPNKTYFEKMVSLARENGHCQILAFTKQYSIVNEYIEKNGDLPENMHILFSGWQNLTPVNPYDLP